MEGYFHRVIRLGYGDVEPYWHCVRCGSRFAFNFKTKDKQKKILESLECRGQDGDMQKINKLAKNKPMPTLREEDVYVFSVLLCDNEIDKKTNKCLSFDSLCQIMNQSIGKPVVLKGEEFATIYDCYMITDTSKKTTLGDTYCKLEARAFIIKEGNEKFIIKEIDKNIKR